MSAIGDQVWSGDWRTANATGLRIHYARIAGTGAGGTLHVYGAAGDRWFFSLDAVPVSPPTGGWMQMEMPLDAHWTTDEAISWGWETLGGSSFGDVMQDVRNIQIVFGVDQSDPLVMGISEIELLTGTQVAASPSSWGAVKARY